MKFLLLGTVEARAEGRRVPLGRRQERCLLGLLLLEPGRSVGYERLADLLWDGVPPERARSAIYTYVGRLRQCLTPYGVAITTGTNGYRIDIDPQDVDLHRFRGAVTRARAHPDPAARATILRDALGLWKGAPLAEVASPYLRERIGTEAEELRLSALALQAEADLALGRADEAIELLAPVALARPVREHTVALLMEAYAAAGRKPEAVALYLDARRMLVDDLGLDPGPELSRRYALLLRDEAPPPATTVAQLPLDVRAFCGRGDELDRLDAAAGPPGAAVVGVFGMAGVGKTVLAVHWAHRVRDRYPDGQLYVNLRGFEPTGSPTHPADALRGFLEALGQSAADLPGSLDALAARYRSLVAGRRMIILLDNARDADQVRDLLPGAPGCVTLVTSRHRLPALVALAGAHAVTVDPLPDADARAVLTAHVGPDRVTAEPGPVGEVLTRCGGLPLALAVVAAHAAVDPGLTFSRLAGQLAAAHGGLDTLDGGAAAADVRRVFASSYRALGPEAAALFRLTGLHPAPSIDRYAAASLAGETVDAVRATLGELLRANLVTVGGDERYTMHDLLRAYAAELVATVDGAATRDAARIRLHDHYLHTAYQADRLLEPIRTRYPLPDPAPGVVLAPLDRPDAAMSWFLVSYPTLRAMQDDAARSGPDDGLIRLTWACATFLDRSSNWDELARTQQIALSAAVRSGDLAAQVRTRQALARSANRQGRPADALEQLTLALEILGRSGDAGPAPHIHNDIAAVHAAMGDNRAALTHVYAAYEAARAGEDVSSQARALNGIGWFHAQLGEYDQTLIHLERALALQQRIGDAFGAADTWDSLGYAHHRLGDHAQAAHCYKQALALFESAGDAYQIGLTLTNIGDVLRDGDDLPAARDAWRRALELLEPLGHDHAGTVRERLAGTA